MREHFAAHSDAAWQCTIGVPGNSETWTRSDTISGDLSTHDFRRGYSPREIKQQVMSGQLVEGALTVIFIRHGRSFANEHSKIRRQPELAELFTTMPNHVHPLTDLGVAQAQAAGRYLADMACQGLLPPIDQILYSPYTRTEQTLEHLISGVRDYCKEKSLHESVVFEGGVRCRVDVNPWVRERYWSDFEGLPADQKEEGYQKRTVEPYLWTPAGDSSGETMAGVADRARSFLRSMRRSEYSGKVVLVVTHGEFMNAVEMVTHRDNPLAEDFKKAFERGVPNCGIMAISRLGFQREMPRMQELLSGFSHELKVVPYQVSEARNGASHGSEWSTAEWQRITKKTKSCVGSFTARPTSQQVDEFASLAQSRGIGVGRALKPRA